MGKTERHAYWRIRNNKSHAHMSFYDSVPKPITADTKNNIQQRRRQYRLKLVNRIDPNLTGSNTPVH